jgi:hypothetical protein
VAPLLASAALAGCGQRDGTGGGPDRRTALITCSAQAVAAARRDPQILRVALRRIESCMADRRLPGYATYDGRSQAVRYAYEADTPILRF